MVTLQAFLQGIRTIVNLKPTYRLSGSGTDGTCDCIGLIIGAYRRAGGKWTGTHGSNWAARNAMAGLGSPAPIELGALVYKAREPEEVAYDLPSTYAGHPDQRDYYHVGVITQTSPLQITHCTGGTTNGIRVDTKIGQWRFGGRMTGIDYDSEVTPMETATVRAKSGSSVRMRSSPNKDSMTVENVPVLAQVEVLTKDPDWWNIRYKGKTGWMMAEFLGGEAPTGGTITLTLPLETARMLKKALEGVM